MSPTPFAPDHSVDELLDELVLNRIHLALQRNLAE